MVKGKLFLAFPFSSVSKRFVTKVGLSFILTPKPIFHELSSISGNSEIRSFLASFFFLCLLIMI